MSKIKDLKSNQEHSLNLVDVLELFSPEYKSKYTDLILRLMKNTPNLKEHTKEIRLMLNNQFPFISMEQLSGFSDIQMMLIYKFIDGFFNNEDLKNYRKFCEYNERGLISQNDLSTYKSFEQVVSAMSIADLKAEEKEMETQIMKIYEDDEWLLLRPLTFNSSKKYGKSTKWCTTQDNNPEYFNKYTKKGVLIYCLNFKTGYKVASFYSLDKNDPEFSYWNQKDTRIDSTESELPMELVGFIREYVKNSKTKTNHFMLSDDARKKEDKLNSVPKLPRARRGTAERVADAVRRTAEDASEELSESQFELPFAEERMEEAIYENRENEEGPTISYRPPEEEQSESPIDRMTLLSSTPRSQSLDVNE